MKTGYKMSDRTRLKMSQSHRKRLSIKRGESFDELELLPFVPCVTINPLIGITTCFFEDCATVAKPLHPGIHHFIDELRAIDNDRLVGIQFWTGYPNPTPPPQADREAVLEAVKAMKEAVSTFNTIKQSESDWDRIANALAALTAAIRNLGEE